MQKALDTAKEEYYKKFDKKAKTEKVVFSFATNINDTEESESSIEYIDEEKNIEDAE